MYRYILVSKLFTTKQSHEELEKARLSLCFTHATKSNGINHPGIHLYCII
jgi:hypothetical protein